MPRLQAIDELKRFQRRGRKGRPSEAYVKYLYLMATGDEDFADKQAADYLINELRGGK